MSQELLTRDRYLCKFALIEGSHEEERVLEHAARSVCAVSLLRDSVLLSFLLDAHTLEFLHHLRGPNTVLLQCEVTLLHSNSEEAYPNLVSGSFIMAFDSLRLDYSMSSPATFDVTLTKV